MVARITKPNRWLFSMLFVLLLSGTSSALTVSTESNRSTFGGYGNPPLGLGLNVHATFGRFHSTGYGIIVTVEYLDEQVGDNGRRVRKSSFYRLQGATLERVEDHLYLQMKEGRRLVAEKGFWGWRLMDGVAIRREIEENLGSFTVRVWLEID